MISIIVPLYNTERYIERCIKSLLNQSYRDIEIIIINDGSTDSSKEICSKLQNEDSRINLINIENQGVAEARNIGLEIASGDYITFVDSDDWVEPNYLEVLHFNCITHNAEISICEFVVDFTDNNKKSKERNNDGQIKFLTNFQALALLFSDQTIKNYLWGKLFKATLFDGIKFPTGHYYEDNATTYKLIHRANLIVTINQILVHYIHHDSNITAYSKRMLNKDRDYVVALQNHFMFFSENKTKFSEGEIKMLNKRFVELLYWTKKNSFILYDIKDPKNEDYYRLIDRNLAIALKNVNSSDFKTLYWIKIKLALNKPSILSSYIHLKKYKKKKVKCTSSDLI